MLCMILYVISRICASQTEPAGITPLPFVKDKVSSFLKHAPWQHTELSGSLRGPLMLTLKSTYKLKGGLVFTTKYPKGKSKDCSDILKKDPYRRNRDGVYTIYLSNGVKRRVFCDMTTDGGGWTVIQRRYNGSTIFHTQTWAAYEKGFGDTKFEYWLGNSAIHDLTKSGKMKLRIDIERFSGGNGHAEYSTFIVGNSHTEYQLKVNGYNGSTAIKDSFSYHNGMPFSTADNDNDRYSKNCAQIYGGGWWYNSCHRSNLNGKYYQKQTHTALSISWLYWKDSSDWNSLKSSKMMIKPK